MVRQYRCNRPVTDFPGPAITISDIGSGQTAADLGIAISATGHESPDQDIDPRLTELTSVTALGVPVDLVSGLKITQGSQTKIADFSTATTVQDMINVVDQLNLGLRMEINSAGTGLTLISEVSGIELSVGENSGGTTATILACDPLIPPPCYLTFATIWVSKSNRVWTISPSSYTTGPHLTSIWTGDHGRSTNHHDPKCGNHCGLTVGTPGAGGTDFNVGLALDGNGLLFEDGTAGANDFRVCRLGLSLAATHLGIYTNAETGNSIQGQDLATVRVDSVFTHMIALRQIFGHNDQLGIEIAEVTLESDLKTSFVPVLKSECDPNRSSNSRKGQQK